MGTLLAAGTFWYKDVYVPRHLPATLSVDATLEEIGRSGNEVLVRATFGVRNQSQSRIYVPAAWYTVLGHCLEPRALSRADFVRLMKDSSAGSMARFSRESPGEVVATGKLWNRADAYFDPHAERKMDVLFLVGAADFNALHMKVDYFLSRDGEKIVDAKWDIKNGEYKPKILLRASRDSSRMEEYDRVTHARWRKSAGAGWGWSHASLSFWPKERMLFGASAGPRCQAPAEAADTASGVRSGLVAIHPE